MEEIRKVVMLYSGGADSLMMLDLAIAAGVEPYCVLIDYGQKHIKELSYAEKQLEEMKIKYQRVEIKNLNINSALTGNLESVGRDGISEWHVPSRNLMFVAIAASIAENLGYNEIWYGADFSDYINKFPDCYQSWVAQMNKLLEVNGYDVKLRAPLLGMEKEFIVDFIKKNSDISFYSGYEDPQE